MGSGGQHKFYDPLPLTSQHSHLLFNYLSSSSMLSFTTRLDSVLVVRSFRFIETIQSPVYYHNAAILPSISSCCRNKTSSLSPQACSTFAEQLAVEVSASLNTISDFRSLSLAPPIFCLFRTVSVYLAVKNTIEEKISNVPWTLALEGTHEQQSSYTGI
jgi:hypothetical protein